MASAGRSPAMENLECLLYHNPVSDVLVAHGLPLRIEILTREYPPIETTVRSFSSFPKESEKSYVSN
jgi:hypothetical protein